MSRRSLMRAGAVVSVALPLRGWAINAEKAGIRLGVASYSFHKFDRAHVIGFMKELGTPWLNVKDVNDQLPIAPASATEEAVKAYKAAGIELTAAGVIYFPKADAADVQAKFEYCKRAGVELIVGSPAHEALGMVEEFLERYEMRMAIHNHGPEDPVWPSPMGVLKEISSRGKRLGLCVDVGHSARALGGSGEAVVETIHTAGARVFDVHMKDLADLRVKESQVAVGDGRMPVRGIFAALNAIGYGGFVDLEYEIHEDDPLPGMEKSFAYMRGVLAGMG